MAWLSPRTGLCVLMFGQYFLKGAWGVTLATWLLSVPDSRGLNFSAVQTGWIYSTLAIAGIVAPPFIGILTDRLFDVRKLLVGLFLVGGALLLVVADYADTRQKVIREVWRTHASLELIGGRPLTELSAKERASPEWRVEVRAARERLDQIPEIERTVDDTFLTLWLLLQVYSITNVITMTSGNLMTMRNMTSPRHQFGKVRLYGTLGWIVSGVVVGVSGLTMSPMPLILAGSSSIAVGLWCLLLPSTPPTGRHRSFREISGLTSLGLFWRDRQLRVLLIASFSLSVIQQFYSIYANKFLTDLNAPYPTAVQTMAQVTEIACMACFAFALKHLGLRRLMLIGIAAWCVRYSLFATGWMPLVVAVGLPLHGVSYTFFFMVVGICLDEKSHADNRGSSQAIVTFTTAGAGTLVGNALASRIVEHYTFGDATRWTMVWAIPAAISLVILIAFARWFRENEPTRESA